MSKKPDAEFVLKGALTRLALMFYGAKDSTFTGEQVADILLASWQAHEKQKAGALEEGQHILGE